MCDRSVTHHCLLRGFRRWVLGSHAWLSVFVYEGPSREYTCEGGIGRGRGRNKDEVEKEGIGSAVSVDVDWFVGGDLVRERFVGNRS